MGHLCRHSANAHHALQRGVLANLNPAVCPSAACSTPVGAKVPHACACWLPVLRQSAQRHQFAQVALAIARFHTGTCGGSRFDVFQSPQRTWNAARIKCQTSRPQACGFSALGRQMRMRQNLCKPRKGSSGMPPSSVQQQSKVCLFSPSLSSRPSLTWRSTGRLPASLAAAWR